MDILIKTMAFVGTIWTVLIAIIGVWSWTHYKVVEKQNEVNNQRW